LVLLAPRAGLEPATKRLTAGCLYEILTDSIRHMVFIRPQKY